ncbi:hypothetical protein LK488_17460, partial [Fusicatenibacter saccharivorans]|nr:hypothetical protein [Fusicatenibacter saccharivorans]
SREPLLAPLTLLHEPSIPERKRMLADKRARLVEQLAEIQDSIDFIDAKQRFYDNVLSGATPYVSVLIPSAGLERESEEPGEWKGGEWK